MKYIVIYKFPDGDKRVIGFTNSKKEFMENCKQRNYSYKEENIGLLELGEDVFNAARIEGTSNFADYPKLARFN